MEIKIENRSIGTDNPTRWKFQLRIAKGKRVSFGANIERAGAISLPVETLAYLW